MSDGNGQETMVEVVVESRDARPGRGLGDGGGHDETHEVRRERRIIREIEGPEHGGSRRGGPGMPPDIFAVIPPDMMGPGDRTGGDAGGPMPPPPPVMLGVRMRELDPVLATHLGLSARKVSVLEDVAEELNGHAGGLRDHDIIVAVDGSLDASPSHVRKVLRSKKPGDTVDFSVLRPGGKTDVKVTLEAFEVARFHSATPARIGG